MTNKNSFKYMNTVMVAAVVVSGVAVVAPNATEASKSFPDVQSNDYFYDAVMNLTERGVIQGYPDGTYGPERNVTRGEVAVILSKALNLDTKNVKDPKFKDIPTTHKYYNEIAALQNAGYIKGHDDGTFKSDEQISRNHMALIIAAAYGLETQASEKVPFTDVADFYKDAVTALYTNEVTKGMTETTFGGNSKVTRGQIAEFVIRAEKANNPTVTISELTDASIHTTNGDYAFSTELASIFAKNNAAALKDAEMQVKIENGKVVEIQSLTLNTSGTETEPVVFDGGNAKVAGKLTINANNIVVKNLQVESDVVVTNNVTTKVVLEAVQSNGELIVNPKAASPVAALSRMALFAAPTTNDAKIELKQSSVKGVQVNRNIVLNSDKKLAQMTVGADVSSVQINSEVEKVVTNGSNVEISGLATVNEFSVEKRADVKLNITGGVKNLVIQDATSKVELGANSNIAKVTLPAASTIETVISNYDEVQGNVAEVVDSEGSVIDTFTDEEAYEMFLQDLENAVDGDTVSVKRDFTITSALLIDKNITIEGNGHKITVATGNDDWSNTLKSVFVTADATIQNVAIVNGENTNDNLIEVQDANVTLENVTVEGSKRAGMAILAGGQVTLQGEIALLDNAWGGIDVSKKGSHLTIAEEATIHYSGAVKANGQTTPVVYIDDANKNIDPAVFVTDNAGVLPGAVYVSKAMVDGVESNTVSTKEEANFVWFGGTPTYSDAQAYSKLLADIESAEEGDTVELVNDITLTQPLALDKNIILEGNGHKITVATGNDDWSNTLKSVFVTADATIQNVAIVNGENTNDNFIEVQDANVTLKNVTVEGSKRAGMAILAGGQVTLQGEIALLDNAWGGIDVSKEGSHLTIAEEATINYSGAVKANGQITPIVYIDDANKNIDPAVFVTDNAGVLPEAVYVSKAVVDGVESNTVSTKEEANFVWFGGELVTEELAYEKFINDIENATEGSTVELTSDITMTEPLTIDKNIVIDGNEHTVTIATGSDDWSNTLKSVFINSDATLRDIEFENGEGTNDNLIEVQNADVTLENVTVEGIQRAGIAILADGNVTLLGTTTLVNNAWGGIDVSKEGSHLTIAEGATISYTGAVKANGQTTPMIYIDDANKNIDPTVFVTDLSQSLAEPVYVLKGGTSGTADETNVVSTKEEANFVWFGGTPTALSVVGE